MPENFSQLGIRQELVEALKRAGLKEPTPVQSEAIPLLLAGRDVIAQAQTGTGKTLAFLLPILQRIDVSYPAVQALILTPTRELAIQITAEAKKLAPVVGATILATYGGQDVEAQIRKLRGAAHVVVATPGRLLDHLGRGTVNLKRVSMLVLDEADQMLHMGFLPDVESVINQAGKQRSTMLFSATMPEQIRNMARRYMRNPAQIAIGGKKVTLDEIEQVVVQTTEPAKEDALCKQLETYNPYLGLIFCRTKARADELLDVLQTRGFNADVLHGDLSQAKREQVMRRFREAKIQYLVATDVAARGLDVEGVTHVFNFDIPRDVESYIHRIGRTGRAGQTGVAVTFVTERDREYLAMLQRGVKGAIGRAQRSESVRERAPRPEGVSRRQFARAAAARAKWAEGEETQEKPRRTWRAGGRTGTPAGGRTGGPAGGRVGTPAGGRVAGRVRTAGQVKGAKERSKGAQSGRER